MVTSRDDLKNHFVLLGGDLGRFPIHKLAGFTTVQVGESIVEWMGEEREEEGERRRERG